MDAIQSGIGWVTQLVQMVSASSLPLSAGGYVFPTRFLGKGVHRLPLSLLLIMEKTAVPLEGGS